MQDIFICQWCRGSSSVCVHMMGSCCARDYTFTSQAQCDRFGSQEEMDEYFADPANAQELEETCITLTLCPCHNDVLRYMGVPIQKPMPFDDYSIRLLQPLLNTWCSSGLGKMPSLQWRCLSAACKMMLRKPVKKNGTHQQISARCESRFRPDHANFFICFNSRLGSSHSLKI